MVPIPAFETEFPEYSLPNHDNIPDSNEDCSKEEFCQLRISRLGPLQIPSLVFGAATLSHHYNDTEYFLNSDVPFRLIRLALRYGISAFDTSPYYGSSEIVLGQILRKLEPEFPRSTYMLMSKCGRYGLDKAEFDYNPETIRKSVTRSLARLNTDYLDIVYLHDVEFVATPIYPKPNSGKTSDALDLDLESWGLGTHDRGKVMGEGDSTIVMALAELFKLKAERVVKAVGITGYPLPVLLRIAAIAAKHPSLQSLDTVLSFCHLTLQNSSLQSFLPLFKEWGRVYQVISASPLSMGLLSSTTPSWHPAPAVMRQISEYAEEMCITEGTSLASVALRYGIHTSRADPLLNSVPIVVGLSQLEEIHKAIAALNSETDLTKASLLEYKVKEMYRKVGYLDWSWASP